MKFSIRDLLLVTVIVALALGWWVDHRSLAPYKHREESGFLQLRLDMLKRRIERLPNSAAPAPNPPTP